MSSLSLKLDIKNKFMDRIVNNILLTLNILKTQRSYNSTIIFSKYVSILIFFSKSCSQTLSLNFSPLNNNNNNNNNNIYIYKWIKVYHTWYNFISNQVKWISFNSLYDNSNYHP